MDPDQSSCGSLQVIIHRQCPREPKRVMVYNMLIHLSSIEDTRRFSPDGRPLFFPLHFNLDMTDADQNVAPIPVPWEAAEAALGEGD
jgi:hypothetical protein